MEILSNTLNALIKPYYPETYPLLPSASGPMIFYKYYKDKATSSFEQVNQGSILSISFG